LLTKDDRAFLTDFGLALWALDKTMGTAFGTPRYIAPEQALASEKAVPQSDIYALAVILYEILTGDMLFHADTPMQIALSHISEPPPPPRNLNPDIPQAAEDELLRALSKEPALRHATAGEFIRAVRSAYGFVDNSPMNAPTPPLGKPIPAPPVRVTQVETPAPTPIFNPIPRPKTETQTLSQIPPDMRAAFEPKPQRSPWMFVGILAVLVALGAAGVLMLNGANEANARATLTAVAVLDQQTLTAAAVALNQTATEVTDDLNRTATTAADSVNRTATASADSINQTATASSLAIELTGTAQSLPSATPEDEPTATEEPTASPTATDEPTATRTPTQTTAPSATPTATITPTVIATNTPRPTNTLSPTTPLPPSPTALVGGIAVEVSYTIDALLIRHAGEQLPADVRGLALVSAAGVELALPSTATLTSGRCILYQQQGRTFDFAGTGCVRENTTVTALGNPQQLVWRGAATDQFTIEQNGQVLATCNAVTRTQQQACSIALPVRGE
jgi:serine/threonine-protein kinase